MKAPPLAMKVATQKLLHPEVWERQLYYVDHGNEASIVARAWPFPAGGMEVYRSAKKQHVQDTLKVMKTHIKVHRLLRK